MGIKFKIISGFLMLALMLLVAGFVSIREFTNIGQKVQDLLDDNYISIDASQTMLEALEREDSGILLLILGKWNEGRQLLMSSDSLFMSGYSIAKNNITIPGEDKYVEKIYSGYLEYKGQWERPIVGTEKEGDINWYYMQLHQDFLDVKHDVKELMTINQDTMYATSSELKNRSRRALMPGIVAIIAAVIFSLLFVFFITHYFVKPIINISHAIEDFQSLNKPYDIEIETSDEIQTLSESVRRLTQSMSIKS